jgi:TolA-binding protein
MKMPNWILIYGLLGMSTGLPALAAEQQDAAIRETETHSVFKGSMYSIWSKLRALSPKANVEETARGQVVVTAGIRGAESTDTALKPYWKEDRTDDPAYIQQLKSYNAAQELVDGGKLKEAITNLDNFMRQYPDSDLLPNAVFAQAMAMAGTGERENSVKQFKKFVKENPKHPLRADAEAAIAELSKAQ